MLVEYQRFLRVARVKGFDSKDEVMEWTAISSFPYAEIQMSDSPYYNETHTKLRKVIREFLWNSGTYQWCEQAEMNGDYPPHDQF